MAQTLTIEDILNKKKIICTTEGPFYSDFFGREIVIEKINPSKLTEIMMSEDDEYRKYLELVFYSCPLFRSKELIQSLEAQEPVLVVSKVFEHNIAELYALGNEILKRSGLLREELENIKKP